MCVCSADASATVCMCVCSVVTVCLFVQCVDMGALVDMSQRATIDKYVKQAEAEGADVYQASACIPTGKGCFYPPTLITKVQPVSICVQEEVRKAND